MAMVKNIYFAFPEGKHKALTMSFDDGRLEDRRLVELFNQYGIRGTFNLNSGVKAENRVEAGEYPSLYKGHEVACHSATHPSMACSTIDQCAYQVLEDRRILESILGTPIRGFAYPNGSYNHAIMNLLPGLGIRYARTVRSHGTFEMPEDFYEWDPSCHFRHGMLELGRQFIELNKPKKLHLLYVWGHSYELPEQNGWAQMEEFCQMIGGRSDIWYATNLEIVDYMDRVSRLQFTVEGNLVHNPSAESCWIRVDQRCYEILGGQTVEL